MLSLSFQAGLLSINNGRAQECFALAPGRADLLHAIPAFEGFEVFWVFCRPVQSPFLVFVDMSAEPQLLSRMPCLPKSRAQECFTFVPESAGLRRATPAFRSLEGHF